MTAWWADIPEGYYALDINYDDEPYQCVGYTTFRRSKKGFRLGATYFLPALDHLPDEERRVCREFRWTLDDLREMAGAIVQHADRDRARFGQLTGRCGCCHRFLTDPRSKLRGIGPDCWAAMGGAV
jgi:hypothetical protein